MNLRQENRSNLSFSARIITKYSLELFLSICGQMSKGFLKLCKLIQKHITPKRLTSPYVLRTMLGFLADAAVQSEARKIILPKYGIREFKAKNFELVTLHMYFYGRKISFRGIRDKVIMLL